MKLAEAMQPKESPKPQKEESRGELRYIRIEAAENGYTVSVEYKPKPKKEGKKSNSPCDHYEPPENYVFAALESVADFVKEILE
jgi:hypothetical protein